ncbi:MAG: DUF2752 domain-containing protein [Thermoguttaceae bacterium]|nr:DUF2752 domain-containing protein [Thermoguttaceae bacterium]
MRSSQRNILFLSLFLLVGVGWCLLLFAKHPSESHLPSCPFHWATGLYCPGCGSTRATYALIHGDWRMSLRHHPLVLPMLPLLGLLLVRFFYEGIRERPFPLRLPGIASLGWWLLALFLVFWLLRNLPLESLSGLRPPG